MAIATDLQAEPVIESLKTDIIVGRLKPNEHLVEKEVCLRLGASRHVVRAALLRLERMGLVVRRPNKGVVVRELSMEHVKHVYELRIVLQREAAISIPIPVSEAIFLELKRIHSAYCRELSSGELGKISALNEAFHRCIWSTCPNKVLAEMIEYLWQQTMGVRWYEIGSPNMQQEMRIYQARVLEQLKHCDRQSFIVSVTENIVPPAEAFRDANYRGMSLL